jgi:hypothetical protein
MVSIGCCLELPIILVQCQLINEKQIGIRGGARSFKLRGGSIKQNESFEKSQDLKDRSEKF